MLPIVQPMTTARVFGKFNGNGSESRAEISLADCSHCSLLWAGYKRLARKEVIEQIGQLAGKTTLPERHVNIDQPDLDLSFPIRSLAKETGYLAAFTWRSIL